MKIARLTLLAIAVLSLIAIPASAAKPIKPDPPAGAKHYTLHILGKAKCDQAVDEDCWEAEECVNGNGGAACSNGRTLFVPLTTITTEICDEGTSLPDEVTFANLLNGVRILVADDGTGDFSIPDRDGTDGKARINIPAGCYEVWARAHGKWGGCMEINSITCEDCLDPTQGGEPDVCDVEEDVTEQVSCDINGGDDLYVLQGTLDVQRIKGARQQWQNATDALLGESSVLTNADDNNGSYFDFLWALFNNQLRNLELRIFEVPCDE
jgi:hypothetical protein